MSGNATATGAAAQAPQSTKQLAIDEIADAHAVTAVLRRYLEIEAEIQPATMTPEILSGLGRIAAWTERTLEGALKNLRKGSEEGEPSPGSSAAQASR